MQATITRSLTLLCLSALVSAAAAPLARALVMGDSPSLGQAQGALYRGGSYTMDGNTRTGRLSVNTGHGADFEEDPDYVVPGLNPGPRPPYVDERDEPRNPIPAPAKDEGASQGGFLGGMSMKTVGFIAGGALIGIGIGLLLGWGWLAIAALAVVGAAAGWYAPKLF